MPSIKLICSTILMLTLLYSCAHTSPRSYSYSDSEYVPQTVEEFKEVTAKERLDREIAESDSIEEDEQEFLAARNDAITQKWITYFSVKEREKFLRFMNNGLKYKDIIEDVFADYGLPKELFYVGLIESGYYLKAGSHAGAKGPWQFMRATGRRYGLRVNAGIDERHDIIKSTQAAAEYFQDLYNIFGNWELALSAYNSGENGVIRRIRKYKTRDYEALVKRKILPRETRNYVPKVVAAMTIAENPERFNMTLPKANPLKVHAKEIKKRIYLSDVSKVVGVSLTELKELNPAIKYREIPATNRRPVSLYFPTHISSQKLSAVDNLKLRTTRRVANYSSGDTHVVERGDNLYSIAKGYRVSVRELKKINNLRNANFLRVGQKLKLPSSDKIDTLTHKVRRGESLYRLARRYQTTISKLKHMNGLRKNTIYPGMKLEVPESNMKTYTVKRGDYLIKIAKRHRMALSEIKKLNGIRGGQIYPGQKLLVKN